MYLLIYINSFELPCMQMTAAGVFDEAGFRTYIAGKLATATTAVQNHVNSRLDGCLIESSGVTYDPEDHKTFRVCAIF